MTMDVMEIQKIIPHRYPFLLVDRITDVVKNETLTGYKNVSISENVFQGHFPGNPIMPGVLQVEALAQVGAAAMLSMEEHKGKKVAVVISSSCKGCGMCNTVCPTDAIDLIGYTNDEIEGMIDSLISIEQ